MRKAYGIKVILLAALLVLVAGLSGCSSQDFQFSASNQRITLAMAADPYPIQSLAPTNYVFKVTEDGELINLPVKVKFQMTTMDMGEQWVQATPLGKGLYGIKETLDMSGPWQVKVSAGSAEFSFNLDVKD